MCIKVSAYSQTNIEAVVTIGCPLERMLLTNWSCWYQLNREGLAKVEGFWHHEGMPKPNAEQQQKKSPTVPIREPDIVKKPLNKQPRTRKSKS